MTGRDAVPGQDAVVPLVSFVLEQSVLQTTCRVQAIAELGDQLEDARALLADLELAWGPDGELDQVLAAPVGTAVTISWDSVLLLSRTERPGLRVDVGAHQVTRTTDAELPGLDDRHALAAELLTCELIASGCFAVRVEIGEFVSTANQGIRADFAGA